MRNTLLLVAIGSLALGALGVAQSYPHAFPRVGTKQLIDNARVTVWEVNWKHDVPQPVHRHKYDMAGVYLRYAPIRVTLPDGTATPPGDAFPVPRPYFQPKGITHKEEAVGASTDPERLAIMVDLKDDAPPAAAISSRLPREFPRDGAVQVLDNARVRMWDYTWSPNRVVAQHVHETDTIEVFVDGGTITTRTADGKVETRTVASKDARFVPRGRVDTEEAASGSPRAIIIELK